MKAPACWLELASLKKKTTSNGKFSWGRAAVIMDFLDGLKTAEISYDYFNMVLIAIWYVILTLFIQLFSKQVL